MRRVVLVVLLGIGCKAAEPGETDPQDTDLADTDPPTEVPPAVPAEGTALAGVDVDGATAICARLDAPRTVACDGYELGFGATADTCVADLLALEASCGATVGDLLDCADAAAVATCETDLSELPCRALFATGCGDLPEPATTLLGGPYGLQGPVPLGSLTESQAYAFCLETSDFEPFEVDCGGGPFLFEPAPQLDCVDNLLAVPEACPFDLGSTRLCLQAILSGSCEAIEGGGPCAGLGDPACGG